MIQLLQHMKLNTDSVTHAQHMEYIFTNTKSNNIRRITTSDKTVNSMGIGSHQTCSIPLLNIGGVYQYHLWSFVLIIRQYARYGKSKSIHVHVQLEAFRNQVDDESIKIGGEQIIKT